VVKAKFYLLIFVSPKWGKVQKSFSTVSTGR